MLLLFIFVVLATELCTATDHEVKCGRFRKGRIVGGNNADYGEFPWLVSISLFGRHFCGGTIISTQWILTAGHCVQRFGVSSYRVRTGVYNMSQIFLDSKVRIMAVDRIVLHPNFSTPVRFYNDIALVHLKEPIAYDNIRMPICLPGPQDNYTAFTEGVVPGWGYLKESDQGGRPSNTLQKLTLPIYDYQICEAWYEEAGKHFRFQDSQMCAGYKDGGKDSCQGDSGGPILEKRTKEQRYVQMGIVSAGIGCAQPLLPGLYTRVQSYLPWIQSYIGSS